MRPGPAAVTTEPVPLRRNRDFLLLWAGQFASALGTRVSALAYPLLVLAVTGSPAQVGLVASAQAIPFLIWFLPAGALVDRWSRKRIMLIADGGRVVAMASVAVAIVLGRITIGHLMIVAFVEGTLFVFFLLAETAALPHLVPKPQLPTAVAQMQARDQGADLAGQPLGGLLFGLGHAVPFAVDAVSYLAGLALVAPIRGNLEEQQAPQRRRLVAEICEAVGWLRRQHLLRTLVAITSAGNLAFSALVLVIVMRATELGASPAVVGVLMGLVGVGAVAGAQLAAPVQRLAPNVIMLGALWWWVAQLVAFALAPTVVVLGVVCVVGSLMGPIFNTTNAAYRYALTPGRLQGRVNGVSRMIGWGARPVGTLLGGLSLEALGAVPTFAVLAAWMAIVAAVSTANPHIRQAPRLETLTEQA
ncbi:MFS transporter [Actinoplanes sp. NPDC051633]|uniref:MFS transporter n=1 Tax=Actinoplanes sp. NPDC051633 TaxID=3155670 RepID=UPI00341AC47F